MLSYFPYFINYAPFFFNKDRQSNRQAKFSVRPGLELPVSRCWSIMSSKNVLKNKTSATY